MNAAQPVNLIEYVPPSGQHRRGREPVGRDGAARRPDGSTSGRPIQSFTLQTTPGKQSFALPGHAMGKGVWLRIAGPADAASIAIGDFKILK